VITAPALYPAAPYTGGTDKTCLRKASEHGGEHSTIHARPALHSALQRAALFRGGSVISNYEKGAPSNQQPLARAWGGALLRDARGTTFTGNQPGIQRIVAQLREAPRTDASSPCDELEYARQHHLG